jgi:hypothetical protein
VATATVEKTRGNQPPIAFDEGQDEDRFWEEEEWDSLLPRRKGWITDYIYASRGFEAPTAFALWSGFFTISSALRRDAWIDWSPLPPFFPNIYVILVSPPGICKKSTIINFGMRALEESKKYLTDENLIRLKQYLIIRNKCTSEKLLYDLAERSKKKVELIIDGKGEIRPLGCPAILVAPELATFIGKQQYNEGMIATLLELYDNAEKVGYNTKAHGDLTLRRVYTTFIGGTTIAGLKDSVPSAAMGDGFLSRTIMIYQASPTRVYPKPKLVKNGPSNEELAKRLSWVTSTAIGEYRLSPEAEEYHDKWYRKWKTQLTQNETEMHMTSRMDGTLLKLALLIKAQGYDESRVIELQDMEDAKRLMDATAKTGPDITNQVLEPDHWRHFLRIEKYIKERQPVTRAQLMQNCKLDSKQATQTVNYLRDIGKIKIILGTTELSQSARKTEERYIFLEGKEDGRE